jgi:hypothetical protein
MKLLLVLGSGLLPMFLAAPVDDKKIGGISV